MKVRINSDMARYYSEADSQGWIHCDDYEFEGDHVFLKKYVGYRLHIFSKVSVYDIKETRRER